MSDTPMNMVRFPKWQCHKQVNADKIASILTHSEGASVHCEKGAIFSVSQIWVDKHQPLVGGYFVVYGGEDNYRSYSPAAAFDDGYTLLADDQQVNEAPPQ